MSNLPRPAFLFFDLGKVLIEFDHERAVRQLAEISGCPAGPIRAALLESEWPKDYERGIMNTPEFCHRLRETIGPGIPDPDICRAISDIFCINRDIVPLLGALRQRGIPMGLLSNTFDAHWNFLTRKPFAILNLFPVQALSFQLGAIKPEPQIFQRAGEMAGVPPHQIFFTDDLPANIEGACQAGWDAVLFSGVDSLRTALEERGVRFNL